MLMQVAVLCYELSDELSLFTLFARGFGKSFII